MNLREMKAEATDKFNQGDVRIHALKSRPKVKLTVVKDPVLVYGNSGNHHKFVGGSFKIGKHEETGALIIDVTRKTELTHQQHVPAIPLKKGSYLVTRAREKGVFDDMINPVAD